MTAAPPPLQPGAGSFGLPRLGNAAGGDATFAAKQAAPGLARLNQQLAAQASTFQCSKTKGSFSQIVRYIYIHVQFDPVFMQMSDQLLLIDCMKAWNRLVRCCRAAACTWTSAAHCGCFLLPPPRPWRHRKCQAVAPLRLIRLRRSLDRQRSRSPPPMLHGRRSLSAQRRPSSKMAACRPQLRRSVLHVEHVACDETPMVHKLHFPFCPQNPTFCIRSPQGAAGSPCHCSALCHICGCLRIIPQMRWIQTSQIALHACTADRPQRRWLGGPAARGACGARPGLWLLQARHWRPRRSLVRAPFPFLQSTSVVHEDEGLASWKGSRPERLLLQAQHGKPVRCLAGTSLALRACLDCHVTLHWQTVTENSRAHAGLLRLLSVPPAKSIPAELMVYTVICKLCCLAAAGCFAAASAAALSTATSTTLTPAQCCLPTALGQFPQS